MAKIIILSFLLLAAGCMPALDTHPTTTNLEQPSADDSPTPGPAPAPDDDATPSPEDDLDPSLSAVDKTKTAWIKEMRTATSDARQNRNINSQTQTAIAQTAAAFGKTATAFSKTSTPQAENTPEDTPEQEVDPTTPDTSDTPTSPPAEETPEDTPTKRPQKTPQKTATANRTNTAVSKTNTAVVATITAKAEQNTATANAATATAQAKTAVAKTAVAEHKTATAEAKLATADAKTATADAKKAKTATANANTATAQAKTATAQHQDDDDDDPPPSGTCLEGAGPDPYAEDQWYLRCHGQRASFSNYYTCSTEGDLHLNEYYDTYQGENVTVMVSDDAFDTEHEDLKAHIVLGESYRLCGNSNPSLIGNPNENIRKKGTNATKFAHGTSVMGIIGAVGNNGCGIRGVAPRTRLLAADILCNDGYVNNTYHIKVLNSKSDIVNESWGSAYKYLAGSSFKATNAQYLNQTEIMANEAKRFLVKSAGNNYLSDHSFEANVHLKNPNGGAGLLTFRTGNANIGAANNSPYIFVIGATDYDGERAPYSAPGSSVLLMAPGGSSLGLVTTDVGGCEYGYSNSTASFYSPFRGGQAYGNNQCNYIESFAGTSAAAPSASGAIAVILSAAKKLGIDYNVRQIKDIIIRTARKTDPTLVNIPFPSYSSFGLDATPPPIVAGHVWDPGWITNGAGLHYSNFYGFGIIDVAASINYMKDHHLDPALAEVGEVKTYTKDGIHTAIPDYNKNGLTSTVTVNDNLIVEQVVVDADIEHPNISELSLEIKSPSGTRSVLMHINTFLDSAIDTDEYDPPEVNTAYTLDDHLLSNAFYGEDARGTWEFKVVDGIKANQGTLNGWRITIYGHHQ